jgi:dienelactone hydrolase
MRILTVLTLAALTACATELAQTSSTTDTAIASNTTPVSTGTTTPGTTAATTTTAEAPNFGQLGGQSFSESGGSIQTGGCTLSYTVYMPDAPISETVVLLSHGFMRGERHMAGWAEHMASWGLMVATPSLCHVSAFDSDHAQNGVDLQALAASLSPGGDVLYIGQSAGGLASTLAAIADPNAVGVLGLDPVDSGNLGLQAATTSTLPVHALIGEPSSCNTQNNSVPMVTAAAQHQLLGIPGADHCTFESPTDAGCTLLCGGSGGALTEAQMHEAVAALVTSFALWKSGGDAQGEDYWAPGGVWYERLLSSGWIVTG